MKLNFYTLCVTLLLVCGQVFAASGKCGPNLNWNLDEDDGVLTITGTGEMYDYDCYSEKKPPWYISKGYITLLIIDEGVTSIGHDAFSGCSSMTSVTIPNSVKSIGSFAFSHCYSLTSITIPNSVRSIKCATFSHCSSMTSVTIPNSVTSIENGAFYSCYGLTSITIPSSVTTIGEETFYSCSGLTSITIPNSVTSIGKSAFQFCSRLTSVTIPNSVTTIGQETFQFCSNLTSVTIPNTVKSIEKNAFNGCKSLTSITIPNSVTSIGDYAFSGCSSLTSITIPGSVTNIDNNAFMGCTGLTSVTISNGITSMGSYFSGCSSLTSITIPNSVKRIEMSAFSDCSNLTSITIPNSVKRIESFAFRNCSSLTSITIPSSVKIIEFGIFDGCDNLKELKYPKGLDLSRLKIPSGAKLIAYDPQKEEQNGIVSPDQYPFLTLADESLVFIDESQNNRIEATEKCSIRFMIQNVGKGIAQNCVARVYLSGSSSGIEVTDVPIPKLVVGNTYEVVIPISADINTQDGKVTFSIEVFEPSGFGIAPFNLAVATKAYEPPLLQVVDYNITSNSGKIRKMEPFTLTFNLQNTKYGDAEEVKVKVTPPSNIFVMDGQSELSYPLIKSGEVKSIQLVLAANNNYSSTDIPISIDIKEKYGKYAENKQLAIVLNQTTNSTINIAAKEDPKIERKEIQVALLKSDVDRNIPTTDTKNPNTFVLILANEHYQQVATVPFALNDGRIFAKYCQQTLGIPASHIKVHENATYNDIRLALAWLKNVCDKYEGEASVIFYYTGHGIPDESDKSAYLLPVDGDGRYVATGYKMDDLYQKLGEMPTKSIVVLLDACFSGATRDGKMVAQAKSVALKVKKGVPQGNTVVLAAAQSDEIAGFNEEEGHGMFTYFLLKKIQETEGNVTLQDLSQYVIREVGRKSAVTNKPQTPCVTPSASVADVWKNWKLK